ncbi:MAG: hypothetical protein RLZZ494_2021 [Pseudomonadota bacterium]|jgi:hypothetical protein
MARRSSIEDLPQETQERLAELIREGWTIDEITKVLTDMGAQVSRSSVGRYMQRQSMAMLRYQEAQAVAKVWVDRIEAEPDGDVARLLPQMLSAVAFTTIDSMSDAEQGAEAMDVMLMARAIKDISGAKMSQAQLELKMREVRKAAQDALLAEQREKLAELKKTGGVTESTLAAIHEVLGITP